MKKRYLAYLIIITLTLSNFFSVNVLTKDAQTGKDVELIEYNGIKYKRYSEVTQTGFIFHLPLKINKNSFTGISNKDFDYRIVSNKTMPNYKVNKNILYENNDYIIIDYEIKTNFDKNIEFDLIPKVKNQEFKEFAWFNGNWKNRKTIKIPHEQVLTDQTNFIFTLNLSSDDDLKNQAKFDGSDIFFTNYNNDLKYNHLIEVFNPSDGQLVAKINITSLSSTTDNYLFMYFNNPSAINQTNANNVFDSDFSAVYLFNEGSGNLLDVTSNDRDGIQANTPNYLQTGKFGSNTAISFDGGDADGFDIPNTFGHFTTGDTTFECYSQFKSNTGDQILAALNGEAFLVFGDYSDDVDFKWYDGGWKITEVTPTIDLQHWHSYVGRYSNTNGGTSFYDGQTGGSNADNGNINPASVDNYLCRANDGTKPFDGWMEEIRISKIVRNDGYVITTYNNFNNCSNNSFFTLFDGVENDYPQAYPVNILNNSVNVLVTTTHFNFSIYNNFSNMNYSIECTNGDTDNDNNKGNGTYSLAFTGLLNYATIYSVTLFLNESITNGLQITYVWNFTTENSPVADFNPNATNFNIVNNSINNDICLLQYTAYVYDDNGDNIDFTIWLSNGESISGTANNETIYLNFTNCLYLGWNYTIWFNITDDSIVYKNYYLEFRTEECCASTLGDNMEINIEIGLIGLGLVLILFWLAMTIDKKEDIWKAVLFFLDTPISLAVGIYYINDTFFSISWWIGVTFILICVLFSFAGLYYALGYGKTE